MVLMSRRRFVFGTAALSAAVVGDAFLLEPTAIDVSHHVIRVPGLPPGLEGVRIACVSDVHLGGGVSPAARAALAVLARERPDMVLLSGDICNERVDLPTLTVWAREARGTAAAFATLGNWEHAAGIDRATVERGSSCSTTPRGGPLSAARRSASWGSTIRCTERPIPRRR